MKFYISTISLSTNSVKRSKATVFVALTDEMEIITKQRERENLQQQDSVECGTSTTVTVFIGIKKHVRQFNSVAH